MIPIVSSPVRNGTSAAIFCAINASCGQRYRTRHATASIVIASGIVAANCRSPSRLATRAPFSRITGGCPSFHAATAYRESVNCPASVSANMRTTSSGSTTDVNPRTRLEQRAQLLQLAIEIQIQTAHIRRVAHVLDSARGNAHQRGQKLLLIRLNRRRRRPDARSSRPCQPAESDSMPAARSASSSYARPHAPPTIRAHASITAIIARHEPASRQHMRHRRSQQMLQQLIDIVRALKHARRFDQRLQARALERSHWLIVGIPVGSRQEMSQTRRGPAYCQLPTDSCAASSPCAARSSCPARCRNAPRPSAS